MARQTNDGEPTYGNVNDHKGEEEPGRLPQRHFPAAAADQLSPAGDEPPLERSRLSEDGTETLNDTLSQTDGVVGSQSEPS